MTALLFQMPFFYPIPVPRVSRYGPQRTPFSVFVLSPCLRIFKFGVAMENDAQKLQAGFGVQLAGCVDLRHIAVRCGLR